MSRRFENFAARLEGAGAEQGEPGDEPEAPSPANPDEPAPAPEPEEEDEPMPNDTPLEEREDYQAGHAAGLKEASTRMNTVFAHENAKGRESHAARLLGRSMSAEEICDELAHLPKAEQVSQEEANAAAAEAAEQGARSEMKDAMQAAGNKELGGDKNSSEKSSRAKADAVWDRANAAVGRVKKEG